jgi:hypothetical protein
MVAEHDAQGVLIDIGQHLPKHRVAGQVVLFNDAGQSWWHVGARCWMSSCTEASKHVLDPIGSSTQTEQ